VRFADALPKTRSGKIIRRLLKEVASSGRMTGDTTTLEDYSCQAERKGRVRESLSERGHSMNNSVALKTLVDNWLTDVQRRGAELYAENRVNDDLYLSFQGKDQLRFSVKIDFDIQEMTVQINSPAWKSAQREAFLLNAESLRLLAKRMCPVQEGQAVISVYLLARLAILCHAYQRLLEDYDREHHIHTSTNTVLQIESELRQSLTPEEQQRTDNPFLKTAKRKAKF
jgi:hypothetical protein